jgi:GTP-binding protein
MIDVSEASGRDPVEDFDVVRRELMLFDRALLDRPQIVAANKMDVLGDQGRLDRLRARSGELGMPLFAVSAVTGDGVRALLEAMWQRIAEARERERRSADVELPDAPDHTVAK